MEMCDVCSAFYRLTPTSVLEFTCDLLKRKAAWLPSRKQRRITNMPRLIFYCHECSWLCPVTAGCGDWHSVYSICPESIPRMDPGWLSTHGQWLALKPVWETNCTLRQPQWVQSWSWKQALSCFFHAQNISFTLRVFRTPYSTHIWGLPLREQLTMIRLPSDLTVLINDKHMVYCSAASERKSDSRTDWLHRQFISRLLDLQLQRIRPALRLVRSLYPEVHIDNKHEELLAS